MNEARQKAESVEKGKQETVNEVNTNDIAYIKGLLYSLVNRVGSLEGYTEELSSKADTLDASQGSPSSTNTGSQNDAPEEGGSGTDNECWTRAIFNCDTQIGNWEKGSFGVGCASSQDNNGWVHSGNTVTYTATNAGSDDCSSHGQDTDCSLLLYGVFQIFQAPDSMLEYVKENYPCEIDGESSDESSESSAECTSGTISGTISYFDQASQQEWWSPHTFTNPFNCPAKLVLEGGENFSAADEGYYVTGESGGLYCLGAVYAYTLPDCPVMSGSYWLPTLNWEVSPLGSTTFRLRNLSGGGSGRLFVHYEVL